MKDNFINHLRNVYTILVFINFFLPQLQSMFSPEERLTRHGELSIRPKEDVTVHLLFAPTRVACMLAKLEIKQSGVRPSQPGVKFTVRMWPFLILLCCLSSFSVVLYRISHLSPHPHFFPASFYLPSLCHVLTFYWDLSCSLILFLCFPSSDSTVRLRWDQQHYPGGPEKTGGRLCGNNDRHRCRTRQQSLSVREEYWLQSSFHQSNGLLWCADTISHGTLCH